MATFQTNKRPAGSRPFSRPFNRNPRFVKKEDEHRINEKIRNVASVRVVGENIQSDIYSIEEALKLAQAQGLDLVEISPTADPPVCRVIDYQKFLYEKKRKEKELKAKTAKIVTKEIRFGPNTDAHDFAFKLKHAQRFLEEGASVRAFVHFKGRSIAYKEQGEIILLRFAKELAEHGKVEQLPRLEGNRMFLYLVPLKKKK